MLLTSYTGGLHDIYDYIGSWNSLWYRSTHSGHSKGGYPTGSYVFLALRAALYPDDCAPTSLDCRLPPQDLRQTGPQVFNLRHIDDGYRFLDILSLTGDFPMPANKLFLESVCRRTGNLY